MFLEEDIFETDVGDASVVTMYLLGSVNRKLRPRLLETLEPGTRIVSHSFDMGEWEPDAVERMTVRSGEERWTVEEAVLSGERLSLVLSRGPLRYVLSGRVRDEAVEGTAQRHRGGEALDRVRWTGRRR